jgi:glutamate/tyrosine decarboxylase-like PLP-dependent enzyme
VKLKTWHLEGSVVWGALAGAVLLLGRADDWREWVAVLGVGFGFHHASVADRLREAEEMRFRQGNFYNPEGPGVFAHHVECVEWLSRYWVAKEVVWVAYFLATGAVAPLVGCAVFLAHPFWRKWYRAHQRKT